MFIDFLKAHYELIGSVILIIVSFILALVRKKSVTSIMSDIYDSCIKAVNIVEISNIKGSEEKLIQAIYFVNQFLTIIYPKFKVGSYDSVIKKTIEEILNTPQKKK